MTEPKQSHPKLGALCGPKDQRDAIHIAIVPVTAGEPIWAGALLKFAPGSQEVVMPCNTRKFAVGIADPFIEGGIEKGRRFYMCMFPYTITSLRHEWTHPAFTEPTVETAGARGERVRQVTAALMGDEKWLREFAERVEVTYEELIKSAHEYLDRGEYHVLPYTTPDISEERTRKFWENFQAVTGRVVEEKHKEQMFFSCSC